MRRSKATLTMAVVLGLPAFGCATDDGGVQIASSANQPLVIFENPYAMSTAPNPIQAPNATGAATAWNVGGKLRLALSVAGMPAQRWFGAHLHRFDCATMKAGGHYEHVMYPATSSANDPVYGNKDNEAWLDFFTGMDGRGSAESNTNWIPRTGEAKSIIIHDMKTDGLARAGDKLACLPISF